MILTVIRHGETKANKDHIIQGQLDTELNENGMDQAINAGRLLVDKDFDLVICSDLKRAKHTAQLVLREMGSDQPAMTTDKLREMHYGTFQGKTKDGFDWSKFDNDNALPDGESILDVYTRVKMLINKFLDQKPDAKILMISHRGPIAALLHMVGQSSSFFGNVPNAEAIVLEINEPLDIPKGSFTKGEDES